MNERIFVVALDDCGDLSRRVTVEFKFEWGIPFAEFMARWRREYAKSPLWIMSPLYVIRCRPKFDELGFEFPVLS